MPHYTESQISAANHIDLADFLISRGEKLSRRGNQYLWGRIRSGLMVTSGTRIMSRKAVTRSVSS